MLVVLHFTQALTRSVPFSKRTTGPLTVEPWGPIIHFSKADSWALRPNLPGTNPLVSTRLVGQNLPSRGCPVSPSPQRSRHSDFLSSLVFFFVSSAVLCCAVSTAHKEKDQRRKKVRMSGSIHVFTIRWQGPNDCSDARHYLSLRQQHFSGRVFHSASVWSVFSGYLNVSLPSHWLPPHLVSVRGCGQTWRVTFYTFKLEVLPCEKGPSLTDCGTSWILNVMNVFKRWPPSPSMVTI